MNGDEMTVKQVAERCQVTPMAVRNWIRGIRVGGHKVRLASECVGTRDRVTEQALADFKQECRVAKYGEPTPLKAATATQKTRRAERAADELYALLGKDRP